MVLFHPRCADRRHRLCEKSKLWYTSEPWRMCKWRNLHRIVVFPALSNPNIKIRTSFDPKRDWNIRLNKIPIALLAFTLRFFLVLLCIFATKKLPPLFRSNLHDIYATSSVDDGHQISRSQKAYRFSADTDGIVGRGVENGIHVLWNRRNSYFTRVCDMESKNRKNRKVHVRTHHHPRNIWTFQPSRQRSHSSSCRFQVFLWVRFSSNLRRAVCYISWRVLNELYYPQGRSLGYLLHNSSRIIGAKKVVLSDPNPRINNSQIWIICT